MYCFLLYVVPDSKVHWANIGPTWGRQDPGGPHVGPMNFAILGPQYCIPYELWPLYLNELILIPAWVSDCIRHKA